MLRRGRVAVLVALDAVAGGGVGVTAAVADVQDQADRRRPASIGRRDGVAFGYPTAVAGTARDSIAGALSICSTSDVRTRLQSFPLPVVLDVLVGVAAPDKP
jgi:hypothetical protein